MNIISTVAVVHDVTRGGLAQTKIPTASVTSSSSVVRYGSEVARSQLFFLSDDVMQRHVE